MDVCAKTADYRTFRRDHIGFAQEMIFVLYAEEMADPSEDVTILLHQWRNGNQAALNQLLPLVYQELHRLASIHLRRERAGHTLQPTALIHEAYLRLIGQNMPEWQSRTHFFCISANLMRQILVDHARKHVSEKRGGKLRRTTLDDALNVSAESCESMIQLDDALKALSAFDERKAKVLELRYIAGLSAEEIADALSVSTKTISRDLRVAEAWLRKELSGKKIKSEGAGL